MGKFGIKTFPSCLGTLNLGLQDIANSILLKAKTWCFAEKHGIQEKVTGNRVLPCYLLSRFLVILGKVFTNLYKKLSQKGNN